MTEFTTSPYDEAQKVINQLRIENDELRAEFNDLLERHNRLIDVIGNHIQWSEQQLELDKQQLEEITGQNEELMNQVMDMPKLLEDYKNSILELIRLEILKVVNQHNQLLEAAKKYKNENFYLKQRVIRYEKGPKQLNQKNDAIWNLIQKEYDKLIAEGMKSSTALNEVGKLIERVNKELISRGRKPICIKNDKKLRPDRVNLHRQLVTNRK
jgi:hypothetical protein